MNGLEEKVLDKIPKHTPAWAVGITVVIVAIATSLITMYIAAHDDIATTVRAGNARLDAQTAGNVQSARDSLQAVLGLIQVNSQQIVELSKALGSTQEQNLRLTNRVSSLEESVVVLKNNLGSCQSELEACKSLRSK